jgi:predicted P-loop ATPase
MMADNVIPLQVWKSHLQQGERGIKRNLTNLMLHLQNLDGLGKNIRFNEMTQQSEWRERPLKDADFIDIRLIIERAGFQPNDKDVRPAVERVALDNSYNPVTDYLAGLKWDGVTRLERWMVKLFGAPETPFVRAVSPKVLIAAVARAFDPGCKVDTVLILEGEQGLKKSTAIAALFGEKHTAESVNLFDQHNKMVMQLMGAWVVELAEFVAIAKRDRNSVKGLISMRSDRVVLPYAKMASTHPRRCIFFATVNPDDSGYLTDNTGNRRYWPVPVEKIDIEGIRDKRDQLWAEAVHRYRAGERWWLEGDENEAAADEQIERVEQDAWAEPIERALVRKEAELNRRITELTADEALTLLGMPNERKDKSAKDRAAGVLKDLGFVRAKVRDQAEPGGKKGKPRWRWVRE